MTVCLIANSLSYPEGGGHRWVYLNWALGLRACGCSVIWLETADPHLPATELAALTATLKKHLQPYGLEKSIAVCSSTEGPLPQGETTHWLDLDAATQADLLLNMAYDIRPELVRRFRRSALLDIDPGLLQVWVSNGSIKLAPHDVYFTIGETVGRAGARFPDCGLAWQYTPPAVALEWWKPHVAPANAAFTTVSHWGDDSWFENGAESYSNSKRDGFLPCLDLPRLVPQSLELALCLGDDPEELQNLLDHGWKVGDSHALTATPWDYQHYIQQSRGEFSCVKPSCVRLQNAWISDRTICYLASGKPAIVEHTGPSRFLPDAAGLFRFRDLHEAAKFLETAATDYERQSRQARSLAEEYFDARKVAQKVLERALP